MPRLIDSGDEILSNSRVMMIIKEEEQAERATGLAD